ncbi:response regulator receiver domain [Vibrio vulnificus]|uniref:response regulator receiver domain n=1 Tax=Vibrio vulnificus TaxID=672 RepID=UPI001A28A2A7|nr:response regulator receiver domain [Vibrio vulnificus]EID0690609.1 hypothetical protein [Vibrio vulnificus]EID0694909.1 hypothetical protein [Vibrio vulnificus]MDK2644335.1 response regulator receiver domain [Vibrio vulnificus]MDK2670797.1 response regulator receiver domain [Vibrio vulnificus]HAS8199364.1 hypothetical protein [Vibrio vulnificus]
MSAFEEHCNKIVNDYVQTVLIIDDGAGLGTMQNSDSDVGALKVPTAANPMGMMAALTPKTEVKEAEQGDESKKEQVTHLIDTLTLTNAFYKRGIVAGIYQPQIEKGQNPEEFAERAMTVSSTADVLILDWMLDGSDDTYSKEIVKQILAHDKSSGGRLRTIVVYTGETNLHELRDKLWDYLEDESLDRKTDFQINAEHLNIVFYNKVDPSAIRPVSEKDLPEKALEEFAVLVDGLVPAFAMKASSAIRNSTGRLISKFDKELDVGYLAHRALLPNSADAEVFMLENIVSYLRNILAIQKVDKQSLNSAHVANWVERNHGGLSKSFSISSRTIELSMEQLSNCLTNGFEASIKDVLTTSGIAEKKANEFVSSKSKILSLMSVLDTDHRKSSESAKGLAVLTSFRRIFSDVLGDIEMPYLTQGSIVYRKKEGEFYLCVTPKCDTARVQGERMLSFTKLTQLQEGKQADIVIPLPHDVEKEINDRQEQEIQLLKDEYGYDVEVAELDQQIVNSQEFKSTKKQVDQLRGLQVKNYALVGSNSTFYELLHVKFVGGEDCRILPSRDIHSNLVFTSQQEDDDYIWIGDLEDADTQKRVANLVGNFNRVGTDEVEWLRRQYQK